MRVDIDTKFIPLIGTPLCQSFAARMQNAGYEAAGLNLIYYYEETDDKHLGEIVNALRFMPSIAGFAVTKPNKVKVVQYLDELDPLCKKMGASNTVVKTADNRLIGYNTDGVGFYTSLIEEGGLEPDKLTYFCFGAGGAGRAMCSMLAYNGAKRILITDMVEASANALVNDINTYFAPVAEYVPIKNYAENVGSCDVVLNGTGIGMGDSIGRSPMASEHIRSGQFYFDACYNPAKTQFLLDAEAKGCRILNGLGMSLYQGIAQIKLWTGKDAPVDAMRQELLDILAGK